MIYVNYFSVELELYIHSPTPLLNVEIRYAPGDSFTF
jgi:hypothetical protein